MFIDTKVVHNKYGQGIITEFEINTLNKIKSKITVAFDSGETKKFSLEAFTGKKFLTTENTEIIEFVEELLKKQEEEAKAKAAVVEEVKEYSPFGQYSKEDWEKAYKVAEEHRFKYESRAVVMDDDIIFISAGDALRYIDVDTRRGDQLYAACELAKKHKVFMAHEWKYATKAEIRKLIERFEDDTERAKDSI